MKANLTSAPSHPVTTLASGDSAEVVTLELPAPAPLPGAGILSGGASVPTVRGAERDILLATAREEAQMAADFVWAENFPAARAALHCALENINRAEQAASSIEV